VDPYINRELTITCFRSGDVEEETIFALSRFVRIQQLTELALCLWALGAYNECVINAGPTGNKNWGL
jgi:hypothetical protein